MPFLAIPCRDHDFRRAPNTACRVPVMRRSSLISCEASGVMQSMFWQCCERSTRRPAACLPIWSRRSARPPLLGCRRRVADVSRADRPAMLLPGRSRHAIAGSGGPATISEGFRGRAGRLVVARPRACTPQALPRGNLNRGRGMERRRLGGLEVSAVGLGCATMTPFYDEPDENAAIDTLRRSREIGVDFLDSSDAYGLGCNEELIARDRKSTRLNS